MSAKSEASQIKDLDKSYEQAINNLQKLTVDGKMIWVPAGGGNRFAATDVLNPDLNIFKIARKVEVGPSGFSVPQYEIVFFPNGSSPKIVYAVHIGYPFPDSIERLYRVVFSSVDKQEATFARLFLEAAMPS